MSDALVRAGSFLLLILTGFLFKGKIPETHRDGIKQVILGLALPAVIFISLQKVQFSWGLIMMPILAITFNFAMFFIAGWLAPLLSISKDSATFRTARILIPSLAPGLSCFPFILEYLGEEALANAAFADLGNKVFVLIVLYAVAMRWFYKTQNITTGAHKPRVLQFIKIMLNEPVNLAIVLALVLVAFGVNYSIFPEFLQMSIDKLGSIMTPLIMLFIGLSIKLSWHQAKMISTILCYRSGLAFLMSALVLLIFGFTDPVSIILVVLLPQSCCSFWSFLHIESVSALERNLDENKSTFHPGLAMNILAMSLPFSTLIILGLCTFQNIIINSSSTLPFILSIFMVLLGSLAMIMRLIRSVYLDSEFANSESNN